MKKIKIGILGYGNLGKAIERIAHNNQNFEIVAIFSRRQINSTLGTKTEPVENLIYYKDKIDIIFLCGGSYNDTMEQARQVLKNFNCIDAFDTHAKIDEHLTFCNNLALQNKKIAFCSLGWDPGLFSLMRVLFTSLGKQVYTTWGKGISQGHTQAIKQIPNVIDGIQYTIPQKEIVKQTKTGVIKNPSSQQLHKRVCYITAKKSHQKEIATTIKNLPNYFAGYETQIHFVSKTALQKYKKHYHSGEVFCVNDELNFKIKTASNPDFTANIMLAYAPALIKLLGQKRYGAYSILDIPIGYLLPKNRELI